MEPSAITLGAGDLLVATPQLLDPNFADTVVLLLDVDDDGVLGVVLNRPSTMAVSEVLDQWDGAVSEPGVVFLGGPVGLDSALAVALLDGSDQPESAGGRVGAGAGAADAADVGDADEPGGGPVAGDDLESAVDEPVGFRAVRGRLGLLDLDTPPELLTGSLAAMRIFAGYSGWGAGQLEAEIEQGSWDVVPGDPSDVFRGEVEGLRRDVLRRQPGDLAWRATRPLDPHLN